MLFRSYEIFRSDPAGFFSIERQNSIDIEVQDIKGHIAPSSGFC